VSAGSLAVTPAIVGASTITGTAFIGASTPATAGTVRLGNTQEINARDAGNTGNVTLMNLDSSDRTSLHNGTVLISSTLSILASSATRVTSLTASSAVFTDASNNLVSVGVTGSGSVVRQSNASLTDPTFTTPTLDVNIFTEQGSNPTNPDAGTQSKMWMKGDKLCVSYNAAGTMRYWTLDMSSASTQSWTYSASAP
jgi:hypothetical protein